MHKMLGPEGHRRRAVLSISFSPGPGGLGELLVPDVGNEGLLSRRSEKKTNKDPELE